MSDKIDKAYLSETDEFLATLTQKHAKKTRSQQQEISKYQRINKLRDHAIESESHDDSLWRDF